MKKKKKEEEEKKIRMPQNEEDLAKLVDELSKDKSSRIKIYGFTMNIVKNDWLNILVYLGINLLLMFASYCIFQPVKSENILFVFVFIALFTFFDYLFKFLIFKYFQKLILFTASLIFLLQDVICLVLAALPIIFFFEVTLVNTWLLIGSLVLFLLVRFILVFLLRRKGV